MVTYLLILTPYLLTFRLDSPIEYFFRGLPNYPELSRTFLPSHSSHDPHKLASRSYSYPWNNIYTIIAFLICKKDNKLFPTNIVIYPGNSWRRIRVESNLGYKGKN